MDLTAILAEEWQPALGCTEPAAVAWATALAAEQAEGRVLEVILHCDPRTYKNCYAVGIPNAPGATGIQWALALGASLETGRRGLCSFEGVTPEVLDVARELLNREQIMVHVDRDRPTLRISALVRRERGFGCAIIEGDHSNLVRLERNGKLVRGAAPGSRVSNASSRRKELAAASLPELMALARSIQPRERVRLREGVDMNLAVAQEGVQMLAEGWFHPSPAHETQAANLAAAGVYARMSGSSMPVMTLAGSGNKGLTLSIPLAYLSGERGHTRERMEEALAFGCLMTTAATWHLGSLSAMCGAANAAGIGLASALVMLEGGETAQVELALSHMLGSVAGMVCDGAKVGCSMKAMTGIEAAIRASRMAMAGLGIPFTNGIVGADGAASLTHLGRLAQRGMAGVDEEILSIMHLKTKEFSDFCLSV